jgi:hypothetical protein
MQTSSLGELKYYLKGNVHQDFNWENGEIQSTQLEIDRMIEHVEST